MLSFQRFVVSCIFLSIVSVLELAAVTLEPGALILSGAND